MVVLRFLITESICSLLVESAHEAQFGLHDLVVGPELLNKGARILTVPHGLLGCSIVRHEVIVLVANPGN